MRLRSSTQWVPYLTLLLLVFSILACIKPRKNKAPVEQPPQNKTPDDPQATKTPDKQAPLIQAQQTKEEADCDGGDNPSCHEFSRAAIKQSKRDPELKARAAMSMYQACTNADGDACYVYGLMVWLRSGMAYDPVEISWAFQQARALGSMHAKVSNTELVTPAKMGPSPSKDTLYHYKQACDWGIQIACGAFATHNNGNAVLVQPPTTKPLPKPAPKPTVKKTKPAITDNNPSVTSDAVLNDMMSGPKPMIADRGLQVNGGLPMEVVASSLKTRKTQLLYCYEKEQLKQPALKGTVVLSLTVNASGNIIKTGFKGSTLKNPNALKCMDKLAKLWRFDAPAKPQLTEIVYTAAFGKGVSK